MTFVARLEARRRRRPRVDGANTAEHGGDQGDGYTVARLRRTARPRDEQEEEGRSAGNQDAAEQEPAGKHLEGSRVRLEAAASTGRGAPAPAGAAPTRNASTPDSRWPSSEKTRQLDAVVAVREVRLQRQHEQAVLRSRRGEPANTERVIGRDDGVAGADGDGSSKNSLTDAGAVATVAPFAGSTAISFACANAAGAAARAMTTTSRPGRRRTRCNVATLPLLATQRCAVTPLGERRLGLVQTSLPSPIAPAAPSG